MATVYDRSSNYFSTNMNTKYLGIYAPTITEDNLAPETYKLEISTKYDRRPDLLAYDLFGSPSVWWIFAHYNRDILYDPVYDFKAGTVIKVPENFGINGVSF